MGDLDVKQITKKRSGFTLIEVVLVLAIGALTMVIALVAFSGAQRARRDTARTDLSAQIQAAIEQYAASTGGVYPTAVQFSGLVTANGWKDPKSGTPSPGTSFVTPQGIRYAINRKCGTTVGTITTSTGNYAIMITQESGQQVCRDSTQ